MTETQALEEKGPLEVYDYWSGLRPGRELVRLEMDAKSFAVPIIHNYGHGSTLSYFSHQMKVGVAGLLGTGAP
jgi:hypothetical protein